MNFLKAIILIIIASSTVFAHDNYYGERFIFSIPNNDDPVIANSRKDNNVIELNVSAVEDANIKIFRNDGDILIGEYFIRAGDSESISSFDFIINQITEAGVGNYQTEKTYTLVSDSPVTANLVNYFTYSSEAMTLIPVASWGYEYSHISYWNNLSNRDRSTGFVIMASEDNTEIEIEIKGKAKSNNYLINGQYKIGDNFSITLDKNSSFNVEAKGSNNTIDITGSIIKSDKKIAVISYHQRTGVFSDFTFGRDNLLEMYPSIDTWGKSFITIGYYRDGPGDYFRILAAEDNTEIEMVSIDPNSKNVIDTRTITLDRLEFYETEDNNSGVEGITTWKSNKPILISQFAFSAEIDNATEFDPTMVYVAPIEQYENQINFKTPLTGIFPINKVNLVINNINNNQDDLENVRYNGIPLYLVDQNLFENRIPGTNFYFSTIDVRSDHSNEITSDVPFYGVLFGNKQYDSYAITVGGSFKNLSIVDTIAPVISYSENCREFIIQTEEVDLVENNLDTLKYFQSGLSNFEIVSLNNFTSVFKSDNNITLNVVDLESEAAAVVSSTDSTGNTNTDTIIYSPDLKEVNLANYWINKKYSPGEIVEFKIQNLENITDISQDSIYLEVRHPQKALFLIDRKFLSELKNKNDTLIYTFNITELVLGNSDEFKLKFKALLWEHYDFILSFESSNLNDCAKIDINDAEIEFDACLYGYRNLQASNYGNALNLTVNGGVINFDFTSSYDQTFQLLIVDLLGNTIFSDDFQASEGLNKYSLKDLNLQNGTYFVRLDGETFTILSKFTYQQ